MILVYNIVHRFLSLPFPVNVVMWATLWALLVCSKSKNLKLKSVRWLTSAGILTSYHLLAKQGLSDRKSVNSSTIQKLCKSSTYVHYKCVTFNSSGIYSVHHLTLVSYTHTCTNRFSTTDKKNYSKTPTTVCSFWTFLSCQMHAGLQEVSSLCGCKLWSSACQSFTLVGFIKESSKQLFPAVPSWDMPCGTLPFAVPDLNAMWQAVGSKTDTAWCLAQVATT